MSVLRRLLVLASTLVVGAGTTAVLMAPSASAAPCPTGKGVTVVADMSAYGQGVRTTCDPAGASKSAAQLLDAAYGVTYVQRQPGFLCRISGMPAEDPCVNTPPADAYWGLFYSDGKSGTWAYSTLGAGGLKVPDGGYVGVAWQTGSRTLPGIAPASHASAPTPSPKASPKSSPTPAPTKPAQSSQPSATTAPSAKPTAVASSSGDPSPVPSETAGRKTQKAQKARKAPKAQGDEKAGDATPDAAAEQETVTVSEPQDSDSDGDSADMTPTAGQDDGDGGLPVAVVVGLLVALVAAALVGYRRRRVGA